LKNRSGLSIHPYRVFNAIFLFDVTVDGSPRSDEAQQESERRRLLYIAVVLQICCHGLIVTNDAPIERYHNQDFRNLNWFGR